MSAVGYEDGNAIAEIVVPTGRSSNFWEQDLASLLIFR